jgi:dTDP-4-dehydrorhamnose 3,5-epimerase-like enzyme
MQPKLIKGNHHQDTRGSLKYNNDFNVSAVKRLYVIENANVGFKRGWQGHQIEQRWFSAVAGKFIIQLIKVVDWENPNPNVQQSVFELSSDALDVLHVPAGYISCIEAIDDSAKLLVMSDYSLGEIADEYRYPIEYFNINNFE